MRKFADNKCALFTILARHAVAQAAQEGQSSCLRKRGARWGMTKALHGGTMMGRVTASMAHSRHTCGYETA